MNAKIKFVKKKTPINKKIRFVKKKTPIINTIKGNKRKLLKEFGVKSIRTYKKLNNLTNFTNEEAYNLIFYRYRKLQKQRAEIKKRVQKPFMIKLNRTFYYKRKLTPKQYKMIEESDLSSGGTIYSSYENVNFDKFVENVYITLGPYKNRGIIKQIIKNYNTETSTYIAVVKSYDILEHAPFVNSVNQEEVLLLNSVVISSNWLKFGVNSEALKDHKGECVAYQLNEYFNNPPCNRPQKKLCKGEKMNVENIRKWFKTLMFKSNFEPLRTKYHNLYKKEWTYDMGVSLEMVALLCEFLKRGLYAYNFDNQLFYSKPILSSKYCPLLCYVAHGHLYIINDKSAILSARETTKKIKNIQSTLIENKKKETLDLKIFYMEKLDISECMDLDSGKYVIEKNDLLDEVLEFYRLFKTDPIIKNVDNNIKSIEYVNTNGDIVILECLKTYNERFNYKQIKNVAENNKIVYKNQGISNLIVSMLKNYNNSINEEKDINPMDLLQSSFNNNVYDHVINTNAFKSWAFIENVNKDPLDNTLIYNKYDLVKCRKNLVYHSKYEWGVYSVMDDISDFMGKVDYGFYYVETKNYYPMRGNGWYSVAMVQFCLDEGLITYDNIMLELKPSKNLSCDHFKPIIDYLIENGGDMKKILANALFGLLGRNKDKKTEIKFTQNLFNASSDLVKNSFVRTHILDDDLTIYQSTQIKDDFKENMTYTIYKQILELEAIELYKLEKKLKMYGAYILDRNTDAVRFCSKHEIHIEGFYDTEKLISKYQQEVAKPLAHESMPKYTRTKKLDKSVFELNYKTHINLYDENEILKMGSCNILGYAGCGKTYLTNKIIKQLEQENKRYIALSPTNKGALLIKGQTIHKLYYKFKLSKTKFIHYIKNIDYIFIDEISMVESRFYRLMSMIKKMKPSIEFIIVGDFQQLPAIEEDGREYDYKNSSVLFNLCKGNRVYLNECKRSDKTLFNLCQLIRNGGDLDLKDFKYKEITYLNIAYTHKTRQYVNNMCMEKFNKDRDYIVVDNKKLSIGTPLISHKNNKKMEIYNNQRFNITNINEGKITLDNDLIINVNDIFKQFEIGFCITIHQSQGETYTDKYTIWDWGHYFMCQRAKYVAISRGTDITNIQIVKFKE